MKRSITTGFADINGARLYFETAGNGEDSIVFVHAGIADNRLWNEQFPVFAETHQVTRYDLRGYGQSSLQTADFSHTRDLYALLSLLGIRQTVLVGCSIGGEVCMDFTLTYPHMVRGLVMVCSMPRGIPWDASMAEAFPDPPQAEEIEAASKAGDLERVSELEVQVFVDGLSRQPKDVDSSVRRLVHDMNLLALRNQAAAPNAESTYLHLDAADQLANVTTPTLVITGALDEPITDYAANLMVERMPNAQKVVIEDTAHVPSLERPETFNAILADWLATLPRQDTSAD